MENHVFGLGAWHLKIYCNSGNAFLVISLGGGNFRSYLTCKLVTFCVNILHRDENK